LELGFEKGKFEIIEKIDLNADFLSGGCIVIDFAGIEHN
jgi:hypothetical protein